MSPDPRLLSIATALPPHRFEQAETLTVARSVFAHRLRDFDRLAPVFANTGIRTRHAACPLDWYLEPHGWAERAAVFERVALDLLEAAAARALSAAGLRPADVDAIVCATTTGIATPSLEALLLDRMGFRPDTVRLPVFGLGCAGGALGLARAGMMARAMPGRTVLFLVVELCTLSHRPEEATPTNVVASALFADGAAAALLRTSVAGGDAPGPRFIDSAEHTWPGTRRIMGWRIEDEGFGVVFSQDIPRLIRERLPAVIDGFLTGRGMARADLAGVICHTGGAKVLQALTEVLDPAIAGMEESWAVLGDCGNMSAASVMFVLDRRMRSGATGPHLMLALGPGFTAGLTLLDL
ncbi:4-hydroxy-3-methyl-6-(1-methyl-2-oxoundecyl)pyran-2-one synthase [Azospirillum oryzae]|uniref:4-hydroxy-3-methyl-6-(1-methyl-2-oxoundecyl)pyran-2-one synthase n=1 Tax=Azospirillum oryzae TaxID=286727 RepID=A0A1X7FB46_9PROT|nr:3-oxoacyl-[acyl-carrier-protein] synthase III C-terminal domain-containing protein [Azospirillum oryzae]SMF48838.1 4-hydroxy-3-methyl-6-(1-methyl-2-oxoundecyl)pyran-2-one synthase [Azospirillum oryzae]